MSEAEAVRLSTTGTSGPFRRSLYNVGMSGRWSSRDLLGQNGPFAARVASFQVRSGQLAVTDAVERVLAEDGTLLCEAGTGIGKTFAYLVPAVLSGRKVIVSTATKALQDQVAHRDLPLVQRALSTNVEVAVMKGLSNYLCKRRYREFQLSEEALRPQYAAPLSTLRSWIQETESGELAELAAWSEREPTRAFVASSSETRLGVKCPHYDECFVTTMKRDAEAAQIVVVNHHLFFADLALRGPHPGRVLPDYDAVIFDEAHQIEDTAAMYFGLRVTKTQVLRIVSEARRFFTRATQFGGPLGGEESPALGPAEASAHAFFERLAPAESNGRKLLTSEAMSGPLLESKRRLESTLTDLSLAADGRAERVNDDLALREALEHLSKRLVSLVETLGAFDRTSEGRVNWVEAQGDKVALSSTPVDMSTTLRERLFESVPAVALLSATLSTRDSRKSPQEDTGFSYFRSRLGLSHVDQVAELSVPSPFDYPTQCALYLPRDLPPVGGDTFYIAGAERVRRLLQTVPGGAFVLTTSLRSMRRFHELLSGQLTDRTLLLQGERPKDALLAEFRSRGSAVLVATASFWEGVDVPGSALSLVVLEKLPFPVPTDPVFQARGRALEELGKSSFAHLALPSAAISLKQGFGRLLRREDDHGVVALLDDRVHSKSYGGRILSALPDAHRIYELADLEQWLSQRNTARL